MPKFSTGKLRTVGIFAGVGGIERGLSQSGHDAILLVENDPHAQAVLSKQFQDVPLAGDVRKLVRIPECDVVCAGFPCQDLSQCGKTSGIRGKQSSLVNEIFRLVKDSKNKPSWILLENVPFMLKLQGGKAIALITAKLKELGYKWAYRTVDTRSFGIPHRRQRVIIVASLCADPGRVLFADNHVEQTPPKRPDCYGFYWTEGNKGLGWGADCIPTLKGGSGLGIPSPPAIWIPSKKCIGTIDIRDAERLQGFPAGWTACEKNEEKRNGPRWRLVGNAVCSRVSAWLGRRLASQRNWDSSIVDKEIPLEGPWPLAAIGDELGTRKVNTSMWPAGLKQAPLLEFLNYPLRPLSRRATAGFLSRAKASKLRFVDGFLRDVEYHLNNLRVRVESEIA